MVSMNNKHIIITLLSLLLFACNNTNNISTSDKISSSDDSKNSVTYEINHNVINVKTKDSIPHHIGIAYKNSNNANIEVFSKNYMAIGSKGINIDIDSILRCHSNHMNLAYEFAHNSELPVIISIDSKKRIDFTYNYLPIIKEQNTYARLISGKAAPLVKEEDLIPGIEQIRSWLYDNDRFMEDAEIELMYSIYEDLVYKNTNNYCLKNESDVPKIRDFSNFYYRIDTNMMADYYYLFATDNSKDLETFIRDVVCDNFQGALTNSGGSFRCYRAKGKGGLLTIFLIGIDKEWNNQIIPIGMACIDNLPPSISTENESEREKSWTETVANAVVSGTRTYSSGSSYNKPVEKKKDKKKLNNSTKDFSLRGFNIKGVNNINTREQITVRGVEFGGNWAKFVISFDSNVKSITFEHANTKRKVNLSDKESPYTFDCNLPLKVGDNYIEITAEDKFGNSIETAEPSEGKKYNILYKTFFYVRMVRTQEADDDINVNINNNIKVNVW